MKTNRHLYLAACAAALYFLSVAKAANHFEINLTDIRDGKPGARIDVGLTELGNSCEKYVFNERAEADFSFVLINDQGDFVEKTPRGRVYSFEDSVINPASKEAGHFIASPLMEPFTLHLCPGQTAHETLDVGKLYHLLPGWYKIGAIRNRYSPIEDRAVQSNVLGFTYH